MIKVMKIILAAFVRTIYLIVGLFLHYMERMGNWFVGYHKKTEYVKKGKCKQCGRCCKILAIQYPGFFNRFNWLINATIKWHEFRYGFTYLFKENNYLLYSCNFLGPEGRCTIYRFRPRLCREYPKSILYGKPPSHIDCGFYFSRRDGLPTFGEALHWASERIPIPPHPASPPRGEGVVEKVPK